MSPRARRASLIVAAVVVAAAGIVALLSVLRAPDDNRRSNSSLSTPASSAVPSSPAESTPGTAAPSRSVAPSTAPSPEGSVTPSSGSVASAQVTVSFSGFDVAAGAARVGGYADTLEEHGMCTLTMTLGNATATQSVDATPDATTMSCGSLEIPRGKLGTGSWLAVLSYRSTDRAGSAPAVTIEVP